MPSAKQLLCTALLSCCVVAAHAQPAWPTGPVKYIVPLSPGGTADGVARVMADQLSRIWGQPVLVENRPGGNAIIGTEALARAKPDGHTIGMGIITSQAANQFLYAKLAYDPEKDFTPLTLIATSPLFLIVHPSVPANNLREFLDYARRNPGKLSYATTGFGSAFHLAAAMLIQRTGIDMVHVPYKGMGDGIKDLLAGRVQVALDISTMMQVKQGKLKVLGVASTQRFPGAPEVPSFAEQGLPEFEFTTWLTLHAPAGLPPPLQKRMSADASRVLELPEVKERFATMNYIAKGGSSEELAVFLVTERRKIAAVIQATGVKPE